MTKDKPSFTDRLAFIQEFVKHPLEIGSVIPSSRYLERRILAAGKIATAKTVVELGPGTGGTTRALLSAMSADAKLLSIEINPHFHQLISKIKDDRLIPHFGSATRLLEIISRHHLNPPNCIVSGIPFSTLHQDDGELIIKAISQSLATNGWFVAYQVSSRVAALCRPHLGHETTEIELRNIPPVRIYRWQKNGSPNYGVN